MLYAEDFTAAASGATTKSVDCEACGHHFEYRMSAHVTGHGTSLYMIGRQEARHAAVRRAQSNLKSRLEKGKAVRCPNCNWLQASMIRVIKQGWMKVWYVWDIVVIVLMGSALLFTPYMPVWFPWACLGIALGAIALPWLIIRWWNPNRRIARARASAPPHEAHEAVGQSKLEEARRSKLQ